MGTGESETWFGGGVNPSVGGIIPGGRVGMSGEGALELSAIEWQLELLNAARLAKICDSTSSGGSHTVLTTY